jgi:hypothetical protein
MKLFEATINNSEPQELRAVDSGEAFLSACAAEGLTPSQAIAAGLRVREVKRQKGKH